jgi:hypothetical protein
VIIYIINIQIAQSNRLAALSPGRIYIPVEKVQPSLSRTARRMIAFGGFLERPILADPLAKSSVSHTGLQEDAHLTRDAEHPLGLYAHQRFHQYTDPRGVDAARHFQAYPTGQLHPHGCGAQRADERGSWDFDERAAFVISRTARVAFLPAAPQRQRCRPQIVRAKEFAHALAAFLEQGQPFGSLGRRPVHSRSRLRRRFRLYRNPASAFAPLTLLPWQRLRLLDTLEHIESDGGRRTYRRANLMSTPSKTTASAVTTPKKTR